MKYEKTLTLQVGDIVFVRWENHLLDVGIHGIITSIEKPSKYYWNYNILFQNNQAVKVGTEFVENNLGIVS